MSVAIALTLFAAWSAPQDAKPASPSPSSSPSSSAQPAPPPAVAPATVTLSGRVVDLRGEGVPVAEVWVTATSTASEALARTVADGEGYFRIGKVPARDSWTVWATADGRSTGYDFVRSGSTTADVVLHDATTLRGVLRAADGKPIANASIAAAACGRVLDLRQRAATTDDEGRFAIDKVPLGPAQVSAWVPGQGLAELRHRVTGDDVVELRAVASATTAIHIRVQGLPDEGRPEVRLAWLPYRKGTLTYLPEPYYQPRITGTEWSADGLPDWRYVVRLQADGYTFDPDQAEAKEQKGPHRLAFVARPLGNATLRWAATVRGADDKPVAGVPFVLRRSNGGARAMATSDADGNLTFASPLAAGTKVVVCAEHDDWVIDQPKAEGMYGQWDRRFLDDHECVVAPEQPLALRVIPACVVSGVLLRPDGEPAPFVRVELQEEQAGRMPQWMAFAYARTGRDGTFRFARLHPLPDPVRVSVESPLGAADGDAVAITAAGARIALPPLRLAPPATVEGVVRDANGGPAPGVTIWLRDWDMAKQTQRSGAVTEVITDRLGRFRFVGVPLGGAWLQMVGDEDSNAMRTVVEPFEIEAGQTYRFDLVDDDGGR